MGRDPAGVMYLATGVMYLSPTPMYLAGVSDEGRGWNVSGNTTGTKRDFRDHERFDYAEIAFERTDELPDVREAHVGDIVLLDDGMWVLVPGVGRGCWEKAKAWRRR